MSGESTANRRDVPRAVGPPCANCGLEIEWTPVIFAGLPFCCDGCAKGGPCFCSYDQRDQGMSVANDLTKPGHDCSARSACGTDLRVASAGRG